MKSSYKKLGAYIEELDRRNSSNEISYLRGISSIHKTLMPSKANIIGTDMSKYKIVENNQFAFNPNTARMGDKIPIGLNLGDTCIVSQIYPVFKIKNTLELLPEYLMMWFRRPEFDRYARFMSHGSAREIFNWEEMCNVPLPVPSIDKQRQIVDEYNTIQERIDLNKQLIQKLEETSQMIYKQWFVDFEFPDEDGKPYKSNGGEMIDTELGEIPKEWRIKIIDQLCDIKGGKRLPKGSSLNKSKEGRPYIKVADMSDDKFLVLNDNFEYVDDILQKIISRYTVTVDDVIISIVGTIGLVNIIDESLDKANLTENCFKLTNFKTINPDYLYYFLTSSLGKNIIETKMVGGVQSKLPMYNVQSIPILCPALQTLDGFKEELNSLNKMQKLKIMENIKLVGLKNLLLAKIATIEN